MLQKQIDKIASSLKPEDLESTLSTLRKIFDNIIQHPNDAKYRQIKLVNKIFSSKVWRYPACEELMKMSGWVVEDDHVRLRDDSHVHIASKLLESFCGKKNVNQSQGYMSSSGSSITKYSIFKYQALVSAVLSSKISDIHSLLNPCNISNAGTIYCEDGSSANLLCSAVLSQKLNVVELLLKEYFVDPYVADNYGFLMICAVFTVAPQSFIISFLKTCGVRMSFKFPKHDSTLLHVAVYTCCFQVVCFLVEECRADVNMSDNSLYTPLHIAYLAGHTHIAKYLIQHGADVMAENSEGHTPYAYIDGDQKVISLSQTMQDCRKIHQVPGSAEYVFYIKLCNTGIEIQEAVTLTMEQFPSLTEDGPTQPHHDIDHTSFTKELTQYITKRSSSHQPWEQLKSDQSRNLPFIF